MSSVSIAGDTSGSILLAAPAIAGGNTATLPAATGTVMVSGNMPAFSASLQNDQTMSSATYTKFSLSSENYDTNNCYDTSTYRFTPNVAGYYQINFYTFASQASNSNTRYAILFYKNGSAYNKIEDYNGTSGDYRAIAMSTIVQMNGTTDYLEVYCRPASQSLTFVSASLGTTFSGFLIRTT